MKQKQDALLYYYFANVLRMCCECVANVLLMCESECKCAREIQRCLIRVREREGERERGREGERERRKNKNPTA